MINRKISKKYIEPSISDLIIAALFSARSSRQFKQILSERRLKKYNESNLRVALSRLNSKGYINKSTLGWVITKKGKQKVKQGNVLNYIPSPFKENSPQNTIIAFDIPEKDRVIRNWLRNQIKIFNYKLLQQSLWIGPGPLPENFLKRLEELNIRKNIKTFKINKSKN